VTAKAKISMFPRCFPFSAQPPQKPKELMNVTKVYRLSKGFYGRAKNCWRTAKPKVEKALQYAYRDRRQKKRVLRRIWITQINAATRQYGLVYSQFQNGLEVSNIALNRKVLAELAVHEPYSFWALVNQVQSTIKWRDWRSKQVSSIPQKFAFLPMSYEDVKKKLGEEDRILALPTERKLADVVEQMFGDVVKKAEAQNNADLASGKLKSGKPQYEMTKEERAKFLKDAAAKAAKDQAAKGGAKAAPAKK
jgi:large subunit ribosomal protein L20